MKHRVSQKLGDIVEFISRGKSPSYVEHSEIKVLNQKAIRWGNIQEEFLKYHNPRVEINNQYFIRKNDIVVNSTGDITIGRAYLFKNINCKMFADSHVTIIRLKKNIAIPEYLIQLFPTKTYQTLIYNLVTGATGQLELSRANLLKLPILLPPIPIQKKIAAILSAYEDLIENNNRRIAILEKMAEELYREWFVRLRFPGHEKVKIVKGVPEGWEVVKLGDVCKVARGSSPRPITDIKYFQDGNIPWIKIADATSSKMFIFNTKECVNEFGASFSRKLPRESLIIATSGTLGFCILLGVEGCVHDGWMYLTQYQKNIKPSFIYYVINSYKEHLNNLSYGAAIQNINTEIIRRLSIMVPSLYIIDKFYLIVNPIQKNIYSLGKENILLQNIRDRLLSRLMSGKIDVENMDIQFPTSMRRAEPVEAQEESVDA